MPPAAPTGDAPCAATNKDPSTQAAAATRRHLLGCAALGLGAALAPGLCGASSAARPSAGASFYDNFRGMKLLDQEGRRFEPGALQGRTLLIHFIFTACSTVCPVQIQALGHVQRKLPAAVRSQFHMVSVSLDPLSDTPKTLKAYALSRGVDLAGWSFVTGRPDDIERLSDALRLYRPGPDVRRPDDHATGLWLIDRSGQVRMRYDGNPPDVKRLLQEIPTLTDLTRRAGA